MTLTSGPVLLQLWAVYMVIDLSFDISDKFVFSDPQQPWFMRQSHLWLTHNVGLFPVEASRFIHFNVQSFPAIKFFGKIILMAVNVQAVQERRKKELIFKTLGWRH